MSCREKAVDLLSRRPHFRRQLEQKLSSRGFSSDEVETTLARLEELGYLDDVACARGFVTQRLRRGPLGRRRLRAELSRRGADAEDIDTVLTELVPQDDLELARRAMETWVARKGGNRAALARYLDRQGFTQRGILGALEGYADGEEPPG